VASIGGLSVLTMQGELSEPLGTLEDITPPWADGHAYRAGPDRAGVRQVRTTADVSSAESGIATARAAYEALKGALVTVVDPWGVSWTNVGVVDVRVRFRKLGGIAGGAVDGADAQLVADWDLQVSAAQGA